MQWVMNNSLQLLRLFHFSFAAKCGTHRSGSALMVSKDMEYKILMVLTVCLMIMGACEIAVSFCVLVLAVVVQSVGESGQSFSPHNGENSELATVSEVHSLSGWVLHVFRRIDA